MRLVCDLWVCHRTGWLIFYTNKITKVTGFAMAHFQWQNIKELTKSLIGIIGYKCNIKFMSIYFGCAVQLAGS